MGNTTSTNLPTTYELSSGQCVTIRRIQSSDATLLVDMFHHLSNRTRRLRFHAYMENLPQERIWREAVALSDLDSERQVAIVAVFQDDTGPHIVGVARFVRATADAAEAETAVVVRDDFQRMGLGTQLLSSLIPIAQSMGIERLFGWVMSENRHMMQIIGKTDLPVHRENHSGETFVVLSITPDEPKPRRNNGPSLPNRQNR
jgi:acetyltransferase